MHSFTHATSLLLWVSIWKCAITVVWVLVILGTLGSQRFSRIVEETLDMFSFMWVHWDTLDNSKWLLKVKPVVASLCKSTTCTRVHTRFQRSFKFQSSIIVNLCGGFIRSVPPSVCACVSWFDVENVCGTTVRFHYWKYAIFLGLEPKSGCMGLKIPYVAIFYCLGWLISWLWFGTTFRHVCHPKKKW